MSTEIRCPSCNRAWHVDQTPPRGEMLCPVCLTRIDLAGTAPRPQPPPAAATRGAGAIRDAPRSAAARGAAAAQRRPAAPAAGPAATTTLPLPEEIVCPRCNLHFSPFSKRSRPEAGPPRRRKRVLVVDDQKYFREIAADALSAAFDVETAVSAHEARLAIGRGGVDLIVLDLTLDDGDAGHDLLRTLNPKPCPIVLFTAQDSELYGRRWEELESIGADDLVVKGMHCGESLLRKVAVLLGVSLEELEERRPIG